MRGFTKREGLKNKFGDESVYKIWGLDGRVYKILHLDGWLYKMLDRDGGLQNIGWGWEGLQNMAGLTKCGRVYKI